MDRPTHVRNRAFIALRGSCDLSAMPFFCGSLCACSATMFLGRLQSIVEAYMQVRKLGVLGKCLRTTARSPQREIMQAAEPQPYLVLDAVDRSALF